MEKLEQKSSPQSRKPFKKFEEGSEIKEKEMSDESIKNGNVEFESLFEQKI